MTRAYFDPSRESDPYALPDLEIFYMSADDIADLGEDGEGYSGPGWYWWPCFPGCLPDSDAIGPFATEAKALEDAREE